LRGVFRSVLRSDYMSLPRAPVSLGLKFLRGGDIFGLATFVGCWQTFQLLLFQPHAGFERISFYVRARIACLQSGAVLYSRTVQQLVRKSPCSPIKNVRKPRATRSRISGWPRISHPRPTCSLPLTPSFHAVGQSMKVRVRRESTNPRGRAQAYTSGARRQRERLYYALPLLLLSTLHRPETTRCVHRPKKAIKPSAAAETDR